MSETRNSAVPYLSRQLIHDRADEIRKLHSPGGVLPLDVFSIVEDGLGMDFWPCKDLWTRTGWEAMLLGDAKTIMVDEARFMEDWALPRLRFTIAHEIGHLVLHESVVRTGRPTKFSEWSEWVTSDDGRMEWQANEFAGVLLVPTDALRASVASLNLPWTGNPYDDEIHEIDASYQLAPSFGVSRKAMKVCLHSRGPWHTTVVRSNGPITRKSPPSSQR